MKVSRVVMLLAGMCWIAPLAFAQQCPDSADLDKLREGRPTNSDDPVVDKWITAAIQIVQGAGNDRVAQSAAVNQFVECFSTMYTDKRNGVDFRAKVADRTAALFSPELRKGADLPDFQQRAYTRALLVLESDRTRDLLLEGLNLPDQAARYTAAQALAAISGQIAVDKIKTDATLKAIAAAGAKEPSAVVAEMIYKALAYPAEHADSAARAMLQMLDGRVATLRTSGGNIGRAETAALRYLLPLMDGNRVSQEEKVKLVANLGTLLRLATQRYIIKGIREPEREYLAETIVETELLLRKLVSGAKADVSGKMAAGGDAAVKEMPIELLAWIGSTDAEGALNAAPWNVPRGAP
jgi:hypothetical protein